MSNMKKAITFEWDPQLYEKILTASRSEGLSIEEYIGRVVYEHIYPMAKRRREYRTPRRFYCFEVDPD